MINVYDKYKDTGIEWLGRIPSHWTIDRISAHCIKNTDKNKSDNEKNLLSLSYGNIIRKDINSSFGLVPESFNTYQIVDNGYTILRLTDLQNDKNSLRVGLVKEKGIITSAYLGLICKKTLNNVFFNYLMKSYDEIKLFYGLGDGVRETLTFSDIKELKIVIPEIEEQISIVNYLDNKIPKINQAISELEKQKSLLIELKKSTIEQAVSNGLERDIVFEFEKCRLKDNIEVISSGINSFCGSKHYLSTKSINEDGIRMIESEITFDERPSRANMQPTINSLWTAYMQGSKKFLFIDNNDVCNNYIISTGMFGFKVKNKNKNNPKFFLYLLQSQIIENQKNKKSKGTTQVSINDSDFKNMTVFLPEKTIQDNIVKYLDQKIEIINNSSKIIDIQINKMKEYKKTLINNAVTGKIKVI